METGTKPVTTAALESCASRPGRGFPLCFLGTGHIIKKLSKLWPSSACRVSRPDNGMKAIWLANSPRRLQSFRSRKCYGGYRIPWNGKTSEELGAVGYLGRSIRQRVHRSKSRSGEEFWNDGVSSQMVGSGLESWREESSGGVRIGGSRWNRRGEIGL